MILDRSVFNLQVREGTGSREVIHIDSKLSYRDFIDELDRCAAKRSQLLQGINYGDVFTADQAPYLERILNTIEEIFQEEFRAIMAKHFGGL
jgi:hypothetical protein